MQTRQITTIVVDQIMDFNLAQGDVLSLIDVISGFGANDDITDFVRIVNVGGDAMVQVNTDGNGNDFYNVARIENHSGININNLDVQDLYDQGTYRCLLRYCNLRIRAQKSYCALAFCEIYVFYYL